MRSGYPRPMCLSSATLLLAALIAVPAQAADPVLVAAGDAVCYSTHPDYMGGAGTFSRRRLPGAVTRTTPPTGSMRSTLRICWHSATSSTTTGPW